MSTGLSGCAEAALANLGEEVLKALAALCLTARGSLILLKSEKQVLLSALEIRLTPEKLKKAALDALVTQVRQAAQIVPPTIITLCPDLAQVNMMLEHAIAGPLEAQINSSKEIANTESISAQVSDEVEEIDIAIKFFEDLVVSINKVLNAS
jgi:hypothetical protein